MDHQCHLEGLGPSYALIESVTAFAFQVLGIISLFIDSLQPEGLFSTSSNSYGSVGFVGVQQGALLVFQSKIRFLELARHNFMLHSLKHPMLQRFIKGLALPLHLVSERLRAVRALVLQVVDYVSTIDRAYIKTTIVLAIFHLEAG